MCSYVERGDLPWYTLMNFPSFIRLLKVSLRVVMSLDQTFKRIGTFHIPCY